MSSAPDPSPLGHELDGRYRIVERIGAGGLGAVYRATHARLDKPVAIKLLHVEYGENPLLRARFEREAKALATLDHPSIVSVTDYGVAGDTPYLVMELLEGVTLAQRLERGPIDPLVAMSFTSDLLRALAFVHERGLVHRDVKPGNVFLQRKADGGDRLKLLDFGLAKFTARESGPDTTLTRSGAVLGTPGYMPPEQVGSDEVDARSDVYSAGVILFQMLAGRLPFEGDAMDKLRGHLASPVPLLAEANPALRAHVQLDAVLQRAMAKRREDRFADANEMLQALEAIPQPWLRSVGPFAKDAASVPSAAKTLEAAPADELKTRATPDDVRATIAAATEARSRPLLGFLVVLALGAGGIFYMKQHMPPKPLAEPVPAASAARREAPATAVAPPAPQPQAESTLAPLPEPAAQLAPAPTPEPTAQPAPANPELAAAENVEAPAQERMALEAADLPAPPPSAAALKKPLPPARNPWARSVPRTLRTLRKPMAKGEVGNEHTITVLRHYNQTHDDDVRGHLLLASLYMNRGWRADALNQFSIVVQMDPAARGAPEMLPALLRMVEQGAVGSDASALIVRLYGSQALNAVDRALAHPQADPVVVQRLRELRARIAT